LTHYTIREHPHFAVVTVRLLIRVLSLFNQKCLPFPVIASLVRLGRKYDFEKLLCEAVDRLKFEYPATLDNYDLLKTGKPVRRPMTRVKFYDGIHFDVITLSRENEIYSVLPCAYYRSAATLPEVSYNPTQLHHHYSRRIFKLL
jgi:hypothetical protein